MAFGRSPLSRHTRAAVVVTILTPSPAPRLYDAFCPAEFTDKVYRFIFRLGWLLGLVDLFTSRLLYGLTNVSGLIDYEYERLAGWQASEKALKSSDLGVRRYPHDDSGLSHWLASICISVIPVEYLNLLTISIILYFFLPFPNLTPGLFLRVLDFPVSLKTRVGKGLPPGATLNDTLSPLFGPLVMIFVNVLPGLRVFPAMTCSFPVSKFKHFSTVTYYIVHILHGV